MEYQASCNCDRVKMSLTLPNPLRHYQPRACDCEFCTALNVAYLSDARGKLEVFSSGSIQVIQQGSEQALFAQCRHCADVLFVSYGFETGTKGAINANLLVDKHQLANVIAVSPKALSSTEKLERWLAVWMPLKVNP